MNKLVWGFAVLPFLACSALAADRLNKEQLASVTIPSPLPYISVVCNYSDCIPPSWNTAFTWLQLFERAYSPPPNIIPQSGSPLAIQALGSLTFLPVPPPVVQ